MTASPPTHKPVNPPRAYIALWESYEGAPDYNYEIPPAYTFETSDPEILNAIQDILCGPHLQQPLVTRMDPIT
jgi:hypothetical protein